MAILKLQIPDGPHCNECPYMKVATENDRQIVYFIGFACQIFPHHKEDSRRWLRTDTPTEKCFECKEACGYIGVINAETT